MEQFGYIAAGRDPMPSVFRKELRRVYEIRDEPPPPRFEELLRRLPEAAQSAE